MSRPDDVAGEIIQHHSKSFALASRLLPPDAQRNAVAVYAWCRRADDAIDLVEASAQGAALATLEAELDDVFAGTRIEDPVLSVFQRAVQERAIPRAYASDLLAGMRMDAMGRRYDTLGDLLDYCYHVAGTVGLMMCHVMGLKDDAALANAAHLGIAMQLTNICRDVLEDWERGRLYLPDELLAEHGRPGLASDLGEPLPPSAGAAVAAVTASLLTEAERYYRSGDEGLSALPLRSSIAIRAARQIYSAIGGRIRSQGCDPFAGRAYVSSIDKRALAFLAVARSVLDVPGRLVEGGAEAAPPRRVARFPHDILPLGSRAAGHGAST